MDNSRSEHFSITFSCLFSASLFCVCFTWQCVSYFDKGFFWCSLKLESTPKKECQIILSQELSALIRVLCWMPHSRVRSWPIACFESLHCSINPSTFPIHDRHRWLRKAHKMSANAPQVLTTSLPREKQSRGGAAITRVEGQHRSYRRHVGGDGVSRERNHGFSSSITSRLFECGRGMVGLGGLKTSNSVVLED